MATVRSTEGLVVRAKRRANRTLKTRCFKTVRLATNREQKHTAVAKRRPLQ